MGKLVNKPSKMTVGEQAYVPAIVAGVGLSMRKFFKNTFSKRENGDIATVSYPEEKRIYPERFRGVHRLTHRADGSPRCVACLCCSTACPAQCIHIEPAEYDVGDARYGYERFPKVFVIDELRCIFCGYCVEACPCDAIRMDSGVHTLPSYTRRDQKTGKVDLLSLAKLSTASQGGEFRATDHEGTAHGRSSHH